jgi:predicted nucleic-acid-binding protein
MPGATGVPHLLLDTNAILRYLLNDIPEQAERVQVRLDQARAGTLILEIHPLILSETVFVLESFYEEPKEKIAEALNTFLNTPGIRMHEERRVREALSRYAATNGGFVDSYLGTLGAETSFSILSFDKGLDKLKDIRRVEK